VTEKIEGNAHIPAAMYAADRASLRRSGVPEPDIRYALLERALCVSGDPRRAGLRVFLAASTSMASGAVELASL
jgi:hypothetical protein